MIDLEVLSSRNWIHVLSVTLALGCSSGGQREASASKSEDIVGGSEANSGAWPTAVAIHYSGYSGLSWCGGTLLAHNAVLTAKHCVTGGISAGDLTVIAGRHDLTTTDGVTRAVASIVLHPTADVALLELATTISNITPARLVAPARMPEILPGAVTTTVGWGNLSEGGVASDTLQEVDVNVVAVGASCEAVTAYPSGGVGVDNSEICIGELAGGKDSCQGDSGGPVFVSRDNEHFLLGVTSEGLGCARVDLPGIYVFVPGVFDWLHANLSGEPAPSLLPSAQLVATLG